MEAITYKKSLKEVYVILNSSSKDLIDKLPEKLIQYIIYNMDDEYNFELDLNKPLNEQPLLDETKITLAKIYKNYLYDDAERLKINEMREEENNKKRLRYNPNDIFNKKTKDKQEVLIEVAQEKWYKKIYNKIKEYFIQKRN